MKMLERCSPKHNFGGGSLGWFILSVVFGVLLLVGMVVK